MFSLIGTLKKSGSVGRWETKQFIGMAYCRKNYLKHQNCIGDNKKYSKAGVRINLNLG